MKSLKELSERLAVLWKVSGEAGAKNRLTQFLEMFRLAGTRELSPGEYWVYGFHMRDKPKAAIHQYLPARVYFNQVLPKLNRRRSIALLENKWLFFLHFREAKIATPKCYGVFHPASGFSLNGDTLRSPENLVELIRNQEISQFIAKPVDGINGHDIFKVEVEKIGDNELLFKFKDKQLDQRAMIDFLSARLSHTKSSGFLIQDCVEQHPELSRLSPSACVNVRIVTVVHPGGKAVLTSASARLGRVGSVVSNAGSGGMVAKIDIETGKIVHCRNSYRIGAETVKNHPDTNEDIFNFQLPFWQEAVELCLNAAIKLPDANSVGWDVLIQSDGPILLEGNHDWGIISEQLFGTGWLSEKNRSLLTDHGIKLSYDDSPKFRIKKLLQFVN
ncbi:sugar-transfer associated ATP-grasp domain-containing protein [Alteromonas ponticola]|uniref:Alpha-L-glutamate ligase-related protein ATP-grasp domain-containing protein n=1 Tax=Alteromonas ponticola TaxID=2720613 RepID=A0ABX1R4Y0_9ALTE|nr:sugar-transfer associated ATP-grasp domain-containing protein [Alteromonas ponticola]NMH61499.1 hypothetical protein [Alteromonas ponticola]